MDILPSHVGAGVFRSSSSGLVMVGMVKGTAQYEGGAPYLLIAGLEELRLAVMEPGSAVPQLEVRYRADGLRVHRINR